MGTMESGVKERTIRDLVGECLKLQEETRARLEHHFDRTGKECQKDSAERPQQPNVLDEIMDDLRMLIECQKRDIEFIVSRINPKL